MTQISINVQQFKKNLESLRTYINKPLLLILGKSSDVEISNMNSALFLFLFNYEFPETILLISKDQFTCVTSLKKSILLDDLKKKINIIIRQKDNSNGKIIKEQIKNISKEYFIVDKENTKGEFANFYMEGLELNDLTNQITKLFLIKNLQEIEKCKKAAKVANYVSEKTKRLIQETTSNSLHEELIQRVEEFLYEEGAEQDKIEASYPPFIQSGPTINTADLNENSQLQTYLNPENVIYRLGIRYERYNIELGRTILNNPIDDEISELLKLYDLQAEIVAFVNSEKNLGKIQEKFKKKFLDEDFLYSTGLNLKESITEENLQNGMILVLNLEVLCGRKTLILTDTFLLENDKLAYLTEISSPLVIKTEKKVIGLRSKRRELDAEKTSRIAEHQKVLLDKLIAEMVEFYKNNEQEEPKKIVEEMIYIPYKKESLIPRRSKLFVDAKNEAILIPIGDFCVPFHISRLRNFSKTILDERGTLRINFKLQPKSANAEEVPEGINTQNKPDALKSLSYEAPSSFIEDVANQITELKKQFLANEERRTPENAIETQGSLIEVKGRKTVLPECFIKTDFKTATKKNRIAALELHENGFKYDDIEILFTNIKHVFFQEGTVDEKALLHFNLIEPIIITKKTFNVQFYKQVSAKIVHDTSRNKTDEYTEMMLDRELEAKKETMNNDFKKFIKEIEQKFPIKVELPYKNKGFIGVPFKEAVELHPTQECIVYLLESPFVVINLNEIEIVNFERVILGLRTSDMVFIFKDKKKPPFTIISISMDCISDLKEFFDSKNVIFLESKVNIQWTNLLKTIMQDPLSFYENNAWYDLINPELSEESEPSTNLETESTEDEDSEDEESDEELNSEESSIPEVDDDDYDEEEFDESDYGSEEESYEKNVTKKRKK